MKKGWRTIATTACMAGLLAAGTDAADAQERVRWKLASSYTSTLDVLGQNILRLIDNIEVMSDGKFEIEFHEPGELVPAAETVDAVSDGRVAAAWAGAGWFAGHDSAFNFFSTVPFGPTMGEYLAWMYSGGGLDLAREMFREYGVYNIPCGLIPPEASGWFRKEIRSLDDLKGLHMRFFGLGAKVVEKLGVKTEQLPPGDILAALESGKLDATEFSLPAMDQPLGFYKVTKYYYFPGWHQQATLFDLYINLAVWESLAESQRAIIEQACGDVMLRMVAAAGRRQRGHVGHCGALLPPTGW